MSLLIHVITSRCGYGGEKWIWRREVGMEERSGNGGEKWEWRREVEYGFIYMNIVHLLADVISIQPV